MRDRDQLLVQFWRHAAVLTPILTDPIGTSLAAVVYRAVVAFAGEVRSYSILRTPHASGDQAVAWLPVGEPPCFETMQTPSGLHPYDVATFFDLARVDSDAVEWMRREIAAPAPPEHFSLEVNETAP